MNKPWEYSEWLERNEEEPSIANAESGRDRELDFDPEAYAEKMYALYLYLVEQSNIKSYTIGTLKSYCGVPAKELDKSNCPQEVLNLLRPSRKEAKNAE